MDICNLQATRERTISGAGAPVNYDIAMSPSFIYQPCPSINSGRSSAGVSNLSAMAGRIDFILDVAGHYAISAAVKAMFECEL